MVNRVTAPFPRNVHSHEGPSAQAEVEQTSVSKIAQNTLKAKYLDQERRMAERRLPEWPYPPLKHEEEDDDNPLIDSISEVFQNLFLPSGKRNDVTSFSSCDFDPVIQFTPPDGIFTNPVYKDVRNISDVLSLSGILSKLISEVHIHEIIYDYYVSSRNATAFIEWLLFAKFNQNTKTFVAFKAFLAKLDNDPFHYKSYEAARYLIGKIHDILLNAKWFLEEQPLSKRPRLEQDLRKKIDNIVGPIYTSIQFDEAECGPPHLFQFEEAINALLSQSDFIEVDGQTILLRHIAALTLLDYRFYLIEDIIRSNHIQKRNGSEAVLDKVSDHFGLHIGGNKRRLNRILEAFPEIKTVALKIVSQFYERYDPIFHLQEVCLKRAKDHRALAFTLFQWTYTHFTEQELLNTPDGIAFLLKEAGVLRIRLTPSQTSPSSDPQLPLDPLLSK